MFTATNTPVSAKQPGQSVRMESTISANDASGVGNWNIALMLIGPDGKVINEQYKHVQALSRTPRTFSTSYPLPSTAKLGRYRVQASVRSVPNWVWMVVTQTPAWFDVVAEVPAEPPPSPPPPPPPTEPPSPPPPPPPTEPPPPPPPPPPVEEPSTGLYGTHRPKLHLLRRQDDGYLPNDGREYKLVAGDEFNGSALDHAKWWRRYRDNNGTLNYYNDELQRYIDNHIVSNGSLKLTAKPRPGTQGHAPGPNGLTYPFYDSSMVRSRTTFKYGYVEARVKLPPGLGVWPAFWILADGDRPCEIDIMEYVRDDVTEYADMVHGGNVHSMTDGGARWREDNYNTQYSYWRAWGMNRPTYFIDGEHTFSLLWEDDQLINYVDGEPVVQRKIAWRNGGVDGGLASVIANLAMGGTWPTKNWTRPVATDPQVMEVQHIRVWQRSDQIITGSSPR